MGLNSGIIVMVANPEQHRRLRSPSCSDKRGTRATVALIESETVLFDGRFEMIVFHYRQKWKNNSKMNFLSETSVQLWITDRLNIFVISAKYTLLPNIS